MWSVEVRGLRVCATGRDRFDVVPGFINSALFYRVALAVLFVIAVLLRIPALFQDLPPYAFCDEDIYANEAWRMYAGETWRTVEFRSGPFNTYPVVLLASLLPLLDQAQFLLLGRIFYAVILSSATLLVVAAATKTLFARRDIALVAAAGFVISPTALAISRYWYPDHYLVFFAALMLFWMARLVTAKRSWVEYAALGVSWGLGLTVKYTFLFVGLAVAITLIIAWRQNEAWRGVRGAVRALVGNGAIVGVAALITFAVLNVSAFVDPVKFQHDLLFNFQNYGREGASIWGITFYLFLLFVLTIGLVGLIGFVVGTVKLVRTSWPLAALLLGFPLVMIAYLGIQGLVINRNIYIAFVFVLPVFALGLVALIERLAVAKRPMRIVGLSALVVAVGVQVAVLGAVAIRDLQPDSRVLAQEWIDENIPASATVGMNEFCSGASPALNLPNLVRDPAMDEGLDYYVINTYWDSPLNPAYRGRSAIEFAVDQEYLHFYFINDRGLPLYYVTQFFTPRITPDEAVPEGYELEKVFSSNGPDILVLRRAG